MTTIEFEELTPNKKTKRWRVYNTNSTDEVELGIVAFYGGWRKYVFFPENGTFFDNSCLSQISEFVFEVNAERKAEALRTPPQSKDSGIRAGDLL